MATVLKMSFIFTYPLEEDDIISDNTLFFIPLYLKKQPPKDLGGYRYDLPFHNRPMTFQSCKKRGKRKCIIVF
jgi:hypothetical protein